MDAINKCRDILKKYDKIVFAYLFGSYTKGNIRKNSDVDVAIYLSDTMDTYEYLGIKMDLSDELKREVDLVILNDATPLLKYEIYRNNILLFTNDKAMESKFKVKTLFEYDDMKRYLDLSYNKTIERLKIEVSIDD